MGLHEGEDEYHKTTKLLQFFLKCKMRVSEFTKTSGGIVS